jgi:hypothetical protein
MGPLKNGRFQPTLLQDREMRGIIAMDGSSAKSEFNPKRKKLGNIVRAYIASQNNHPRKKLY